MAKPIVKSILVISLIAIICTSVFIILFIVEFSKPSCYCEYSLGGLCSNKDIENISSSGTGSSVDPFIIEDLTFDGLCIGEGSISVYFTLQNCSFIFGLYIHYLMNFVIQNCSFLGNESYFCLSGCSDFVLQNCTFFYKKVEIEYSNDFTIFNCDFHVGVDYVLLRSSSSFDFYNCNFKTDYVEIRDCIGLTFENNAFESTTFDESMSGLFLFDILQLTLKNNSFETGGIYYSSFNSDFHQFEVSDNTLNDLPIIIIVNETNKTIVEKCGQVILLNCTDITITNQSLSETNVGITIAFSSNCTIAQNNFTKCIKALNIYSSKNSYYYNNSILNCIGIGIRLFNSDNNILKFNHIQNCGLIGLSLFLCSENWINYNNFIGNNLLYFLQVEDRHGEDNNWNYNYWNDWAGSGVYSIEGTTGSQDNYPLSSPINL